MSRKYFNLRNVKSPWNGEYYIGFVLDVVNSYFDLDADYYLPMGYGNLNELNGMSLVKWDEKKKRNNLVVVTRIGEEKYCIDGFSEGEFSDFEEKVQNLWDIYYSKMDDEMKRLKQ